MKRALGEIRRGILCAAVLGAVGCRSPREAMVTDTDPTEWSAGTELLVPNTDTLMRRDLTLYLRLDERFAEDTLTLRVTTLTPDSLRCEETVLFTAPREATPAALKRIAEIPYRRRAVLARTGDYRMILTPSRPVAGVEAAGIHIEKSQ